MATPLRSVMDTRHDQMFPTLEPGEIERLRRSGELRRSGVGELMSRVGQVGMGVSVVLAGAVEITRRDEAGRSQPIVTHLPGAFMGELAQLSGRPALVDSRAVK